LKQSTIQQRQVPTLDLYSGIKNGESWAFDYIYKLVYASHQYELKGDTNLAFDLYQDVILDLFLRIKENRLEKRTLETDGMIISWIKQHLEWKRNDHWKKSATKYNDRLDMVIHEPYTARAAEAEMLLYYKDLLMIINTLSTTCDDLLRIKLVEDLSWHTIYLRYPNENKGSLRVKFSNMIKTLREILLSDFHF
jgi:hypothetical protein